MIIWPETVSRTDESWNNARALMRVLSVDVRRKSFRPKPDEPHYYETADDYLVRPLIVVERRPVLAPYFSYRVNFSVSCGVLGHIPVDDESQLFEFRQVLNAALQHELTVAEKGVWVAGRKRNVLERRLVGAPLESRDSLRQESESLLAEATELARTSHQFYNAQMNSMLGGWRANGALGKQPAHNAVMLALIEQGRGILAEEEGEGETVDRRLRECSPG